MFGREKLGCRQDKISFAIRSGLIVCGPNLSGRVVVGWSCFIRQGALVPVYKAKRVLSIPPFVLKCMVWFVSWIVQTKAARHYIWQRYWDANEKGLIKKTFGWLMPCHFVDGMSRTALLKRIQWRTASDSTPLANQAKPKWFRAFHWTHSTEPSSSPVKSSLLENTRHYATYLPGNWNLAPLLSHQGYHFVAQKALCAYVCPIGRHETT